jgi:hypothetical protein
MSPDSQERAYIDGRTENQLLQYPLKKCIPEGKKAEW